MNACRSACAAALLGVVCARALPATPCEERIDAALKVNEQLRAAVAASAPDAAAREHALELLDRAAEPLRTACKRGGPWEGEALMRAGGYHGDVRSLLGDGKRPL